MLVVVGLTGYCGVGSGNQMWESRVGKRSFGGIGIIPIFLYENDNIRDVDSWFSNVW